MLVLPQAAEEYLRRISLPDPIPDPFPDPHPDPNPDPRPDPTPYRVNRYHGTVSLDPHRANKQMAIVVEEIIQRLTSLTGTDVEITLEISASRSAGFENATVRTVNENSRTLKFSSHGFEGE